MAMSPCTDHIIIRPNVHRVVLPDVISVLLVRAAPLTGRITRKAS
jgi:hypothetical protein